MHDGVLRGHGHLAPCRVVAVKVSLPDGGIEAYVKAEIVQAPGTLPDGDYDVSFEGRSFKVRKIGGNWEQSFCHSIA